MKKMKLAVLAITMIGILGAGNAMAADTANIDVTANILGSCLFSAASYPMAFGDIDPLVQVLDAPAQANVTFTCANGTDWTIGDITGIYPFTVAPAPLNYEVTAISAVAGTSLGVAQTVDVDGVIYQTDFVAATAGAYSDTLVITITPL